MDQDNAFEELRKAVSHKMQRLQEKNRTLRDELRQERERNQNTEAELSQQREKRILECSQYLLYAARSLGVPSMWAHGLQVMRRKSWNNGEVPYLPSTNRGIYRMLPFCRIKHIYRVAGLVQ
jgi:hypothetical protein